MDRIKYARDFVLNLLCIGISVDILSILIIVVFTLINFLGPRIVGQSETFIVVIKVYYSICFCFYLDSFSLNHNYYQFLHLMSLIYLRGLDFSFWVM